MAQCLILKSTHKFELKLPKMVEEAITINKKNGNTLWQDDIQKQMENVKIKFQPTPDGEKPPNVCQSQHGIWY